MALMAAGLPRVPLIWWEWKQSCFLFQHDAFFPLKSFSMIKVGKVYERMLISVTIYEKMSEATTSKSINPPPHEAKSWSSLVRKLSSRLTPRRRRLFMLFRFCRGLSTGAETPFFRVQPGAPLNSRDPKWMEQSRTAVLRHAKLMYVVACSNPVQLVA